MHAHEFKSQIILEAAKLYSRSLFQWVMESSGVGVRDMWIYIGKMQPIIKSFLNFLLYLIVRDKFIKAIETNSLKLITKLNFFACVTGTFKCFSYWIMWQYFILISRRQRCGANYKQLLNSYCFNIIIPFTYLQWIHLQKVIWYNAQSFSSIKAFAFWPSYKFWLFH